MHLVSSAMPSICDVAAVEERGTMMRAALGYPRAAGCRFLATSSRSNYGRRARATCVLDYVASDDRVARGWSTRIASLLTRTVLAWEQTRIAAGFHSSSIQRKERCCSELVQRRSFAWIRCTPRMPRSFRLQHRGGRKRRNRLAVAALHPNRYLGASAASDAQRWRRRLEVNEAWRIGREPSRRAKRCSALGRRGGWGWPWTPRRSEFLMQIWQQRVASSEAKRARYLDRVRRMQTPWAPARATSSALSEGFRASRRLGIASLGNVGELSFTGLPRRVSGGD